MVLDVTEVREPVGEPVGEPARWGITVRRASNLLTARFVSNVTKIGRHADGLGLYLHVRKRGDQVERLWLFRYRSGPRGAEKERVLSLGPARDVPLATARRIAGQCRELLAVGRDPREALTPETAPTLGRIIDDYVGHLEETLKNPKSWKLTLGDTYCRAIRSKPIDQVMTDDVLGILKPIWHTKPETAQRLRARLERVMDSAKVKGLYRGDNPARWRGHLQHLLSAPQQLSRGHHAALSWRDVPAFMVKLRKLESVSALALEWTILTCARTNETRGAVMSEIDRERGLWIVPAARMKGRGQRKREHRVPLTDRCLEILDEAEKLGGVYLFPGLTLKRPLSYMAMLECLKGLQPGVPVHGFRSSFRDWVGETTSYPDHLAEAALAHIVGDKTERAYKRGDALERRRALMVDWARYCDPSAGQTSDNVLDFTARREAAG